MDTGFDTVTIIQKEMGGSYDHYTLNTSNLDAYERPNEFTIKFPVLVSAGTE